jgi:hypothetical protein
VLADACDEAKQGTGAARQNEQAMAGRRFMGHDFSSGVSNGFCSMPKRKA